MSKCDWCKRKGETVEYVDELGKKYNICSKCNEKVLDGICRCCGSDITFFSIEGKCYKCAQNAQTEAHKNDNEVIDGLIGELESVTDADREFIRKAYKKYVDEESDYSVGDDWTDEQFERMQLIGSRLSPKVMLKDTPNAKQWRYVWTFVKLNNGSIKRDPELIHKYFPIIDRLLLDNTDLLRDNTKEGLACKKCHIVICNTPEDRKLLKSGEIIVADESNGVYIVEGLGDVVKD